MKNKKIDLIIFDWDGTLVDSIGWIVQCMQQAAAANGLAVPTEAAVRNVIGLSIERALQALFIELDEKDREHFIKSYSQLFFAREISPEDVFEGVPDMLEQFKLQGFLLAVATGKRSTGLAKAMKGTGLESYFDATCGADQAVSKPDPLMIHRITEQLQVDKERTIMVGDSIHDLQMAENAHIDAVAVSCGAHSAEQLKQYQPLICLQQTRELKKHIS
jgi:phosphoglycolate phosphatase